MKQTNWDGKEVLLVEQSDSILGWWLTPDGGGWCFAFKNVFPTEQEAGEWVERVSGWVNDVYYNYSVDGRDYRDIVESAFKSKIESLHSRIRSEGFPHPERVVLLTKK